MPTSADQLKLIRERVPQMPIVVLVKQPDLTGHRLDIQDYIMNGESVIPLFSSGPAMAQSLRGTDLGRPTYAIDRALLAQMLRENPVFLLDPQLPWELRFTLAELKEAFPEGLARRRRGNWMREMVVRVWLVFAVVAAGLLVPNGCTHPRRWFSNRSVVRDSLVRLPDDGAVVVEVAMTESFGHARPEPPPRYVWQQPGRETKVLTVTGTPPAAVLDSASTSSRLSEDGNVAELLANGRVVATFDYAAGTATFAK